MVHALQLSISLSYGLCWLGLWKSRQKLLQDIIYKNYCSSLSQSCPHPMTAYVGLQLPQFGTSLKNHPHFIPCGIGSTLSVVTASRFSVSISPSCFPWLPSSCYQEHCSINFNLQLRMFPRAASLQQLVPGMLLIADAEWDCGAGSVFVCLAMRTP